MSFLLRHKFLFGWFLFATILMAMLFGVAAVINVLYAFGAWIGGGINVLEVFLRCIISAIVGGLVLSAGFWAQEEIGD